MELATCSSSVDLPIPGSPPTSTTEPGTIPPPSTRSNSSIPLESLGVCASSISPMATASASTASLPPIAAARDCARASVAGGVYGSRLFHAPQSGHFPNHLLCTPPHWLHRNCVRVLAIEVILPSVHRGRSSYTHAVAAQVAKLAD